MVARHFNAKPIMEHSTGHAHLEQVSLWKIREMRRQQARQRDKQLISDLHREVARLRKELVMAQSYDLRHEVSWLRQELAWWQHWWDSWPSHRQCEAEQIASIQLEPRASVIDYSKWAHVGDESENGNSDPEDDEYECDDIYWGQEEDEEEEADDEEIAKCGDPAEETELWLEDVQHGHESEEENVVVSVANDEDEPTGDDKDLEQAAADDPAKNKQNIIEYLEMSGQVLEEHFDEVKDAFSQHEHVLSSLWEARNQQQQQQARYIHLITQMRDGEFHNEGTLALRSLIKEWRMDTIRRLAELRGDGGQ